MVGRAQDEERMTGLLVWYDTKSNGPPALYPIAPMTQVAISAEVLVWYAEADYFAVDQYCRGARGDDSTLYWNAGITSDKWAYIPYPTPDN